MLFRASRLIATFILVFVITFVILNGRFVIADLKYQFGLIPPTVSVLPSPSPIFNTPAPLPNQATLTISKLGVSAPIVFGIPANTKDIFNNLENGVVHYSISPKPGEGGVSIILGHSSAYPWYKGQFGSVFALLGKLQTGDIFTVSYIDGRVFTYQVKQQLVFNPLIADDPRVTEFESTSKPAVILLSCWPVGTNYKRIAVLGEQI